MAFTQAQTDAVLVALRQRNADSRQCSVCGNRKWIVQTDGLVYLVMSTPPVPYPTWRPSDPSLPSIAIVCAVCGNTHLLNVFVLGLGPVFGLTPNV